MKTVSGGSEVAAFDTCKNQALMFFKSGLHAGNRRTNNIIVISNIDVLLQCFLLFLNSPIKLRTVEISTVKVYFEMGLMHQIVQFNCF